MNYDAGNGTMKARSIGDQVFVTADNYGSPATIIDVRESVPDVAPVSRYKVRTNTGDEFWAFDFEISDPQMYDSTQDTLDHISKVQERLRQIRLHLRIRGDVHDSSKLIEPEKSGYDQLTIKLKDCVYGSDEYRAALTEAKPVIDHHYAHNLHHPEHYENGLAGMSLLDVIEMLCDWKAASERTKQGSIAQSLAHNKQRFGIDDQLASILENTVRELEW